MEESPHPERPKGSQSAPPGTLPAAGGPDAFASPASGWPWGFSLPSWGDAINPLPNPANDDPEQRIAPMSMQLHVHDNKALYAIVCSVGVVLDDDKSECQSRKAFPAHVGRTCL